MRLTFKNILYFSLAAGLSATTNAWANPKDGTVVGGSAEIVHETPAKTTINQYTDKAIVDWRSFSIGVGEHTQFVQPSSSSVILNRVTGGQASEILGRLSANGRVFLSNPNGIVFGVGSRVDVNGLLATTSGIENRDFMAGRYDFNIPGNPNATVVNNGTINTAEGGFAILAAPGVQNTGSITARLGRVELASTNGFVLNFNNNALINFIVDKQVLETVRMEDGTPLSALVDNSGNITAAGGFVRLSANAARRIADSTISSGGFVDAHSVGMQNGKIVLWGGDDGEVLVSGTLDASGKEAGQTGGTVHVTGKHVGVYDGAKIDASGDSGGGTVLVGGDYKGQGTLPNAEATYIAQGASVAADAITQGNGGKLIVWSDDVTRSYGALSARGGAQGGDGGFIETSSKNFLDVRGAPDASAPKGKGGTWLIDPRNINIKTGVTAGSFSGGDPSVFQPSSSISTLLNTDLNTVLNAGTDVQITTVYNSTGQTGTIYVYEPISKTAGGDATLTFTINNTIYVQNTISSSSGKLNLVFETGRPGMIGTSYSGDIWIQADIDTNGGSFSAEDYDDGGGMVVTNSNTLTTGNGSVTVDLGLLSIESQASINAGSGNVTITTTNSFSESSRITTTGTLTINAGGSSSTTSSSTSETHESQVTSVAEQAQAQATEIAVDIPTVEENPPQTGQPSQFNKPDSTGLSSDVRAGIKSEAKSMFERFRAGGEIVAALANSFSSITESVISQMPNDVKIWMNTSEGKLALQEAVRKNKAKFNPEKFKGLNGQYMEGLSKNVVWSAIQLAVKDSAYQGNNFQQALKGLKSVIADGKSGRPKQVVESAFDRMLLGRSSVGDENRVIGEIASYVKRVDVPENAVAGADAAVAAATQESKTQREKRQAAMERRDREEKEQKKKGNLEETGKTKSSSENKDDNNGQVSGDEEATRLGNDNRPGEVQQKPGDKDNNAGKGTPSLPPISFTSPVAAANYVDENGISKSDLLKDPYWPLYPEKLRNDVLSIINLRAIAKATKLNDEQISTVIQLLAKKDVLAEFDELKIDKKFEAMDLALQHPEVFGVAHKETQSEKRERIALSALISGAKNIENGMKNVRGAFLGDDTLYSKSSQPNAQNVSSYFSGDRSPQVLLGFVQIAAGTIESIAGTAAAVALGPEIETALRVGVNLASLANKSLRNKLIKTLGVEKTELFYDLMSRAGARISETAKPIGKFLDQPGVRESIEVASAVFALKGMLPTQSKKGRSTGRKLNTPPEIEGVVDNILFQSQQFINEAKRNVRLPRQSRTKNPLTPLEFKSLTPQGTLDPSRIRTTQNDAGRRFKATKKGVNDGVPIETLIYGLRTGRVLPGDVEPIRIFEKDGKIYTLDNRRVISFRLVNMKIPYRMATVEEIVKDIIEGNKFSTADLGMSIILKEVR